MAVLLQYKNQTHPSQNAGKRHIKKINKTKRIILKKRFIFVSHYFDRQRGFFFFFFFTIIRFEPRPDPSYRDPDQHHWC